MKKKLTVLLLSLICALSVFGTAACGAPLKQGTDAPAQDQEGDGDQSQGGEQGGELNPPSGGENGETVPPEEGGDGEATPPSGGESGETLPPEEGEGGEVTPPSGGENGETVPPEEGGGEVSPPSGGEDGEVTPPAIEEDEALKATQAYAVWRKYIDGISAQDHACVARSVYPENTSEYQNFLTALQRGTSDDPALSGAVDELKGAAVSNDYVVGGEVSDGRATLNIAAEINGEAYTYDVALFQSMLDGSWYFDGLPSLYRGCPASQEKAEFEFTAEYASLVRVRYRYIALTLPDSVNGYPVRRIKTDAFGAGSGQKGGALTSLTIPSSVTHIEKGALYACSAKAGGVLSELTLAFLGINAAQKGCLGGAFGADSYLQNREYVPASLQTVSICGGTIWERAFSDCDSIRTVVLGKEVGGIEKEAFSECAALRNVTVGEAVTQIGQSAFSKCDQLAEVAFAADCKLEAIEKAAFEMCGNLKSIRFPERLKTIGTAAFRQCSKIEEVTFGENLGSIGDAAFESCGLVSVAVLGNSEIGYGAFDGCVSLERVTLRSQQVLVLNEDFFAANDVFLIYVPEALFYDYQLQYMMYENRFVATL